MITNFIPDESQGPYIMIIDDDVGVLSLLQGILESNGLKTITCSSAEEGLKALESSEVKLLLLDVIMPGMNGINAYEKVKELKPSLPVIMMTGIAEIDIARKCLALGAKDFIQKPFDIDYLETTVFVQIIPQL